MRFRDKKQLNKFRPSGLGMSISSGTAARNDGLSEAIRSKKDADVFLAELKSIAKQEKFKK